ncbi:MAG: hypothetical protein U1C71_00955, partial [archaeon]|nr:hypothetical protein [archaeon]
KTGMEFTGELVKGNSIPLNGTNVLPGNTPSNRLGSVEEILRLVKQDAMCVRSTGAKIEFFWNPKEVMNALTKQEKEAETMCIVK